MLIGIVAGPIGWGDCAPLPSSGEAGHARTFAAAAAALAQGFVLAKIKVGVSGVEDELRLLREASSRVEGRLRLRLDANRA